ncbi:hypothetical protein TTRE_0000263601 [Trichuris trichiura]|uniref:Uncharacterized protein n=1 Tax=Trichuris trichiura TaxID=36087 RepID=A0A077Z2V4_TRITR|nr:hypothetical protein TTRE_0000263601 [Trichuris trichiura]
MNTNTIKKKNAFGQQDDLIDLTNSPACLPCLASSTPASLPKRTLLDQTIFESPQLITMPRKYTDMSDLDKSDQEGLLSTSDFERLSNIALCDDSLPSNMGIVPPPPPPVTVVSSMFRKPVRGEKKRKSLGIPRTLAKYQSALPKFPKLKMQPVLPLPDEITRTIEVYALNRRIGKRNGRVENTPKRAFPFLNRKNDFNVAANGFGARKPFLFPNFTPIGVKMKIVKPTRALPATSTPMDYAGKAKGPSKVAPRYRENKASLLRKKANKHKVKTCWRRK